MILHKGSARKWVNFDYNNFDYKQVFQIDDDMFFQIDDVEISGKELKTCIKYMLELTKVAHPEEFI